MKGVSSATKIKLLEAQIEELKITGGPHKKNIVEPRKNAIRFLKKNLDKDFSWVELEKLFKFRYYLY